MRNGYRVFDADTHVHATAESLEPFLSDELRARLPNLDTFKSPFKTGWAGEMRRPSERTGLIASLDAAKQPRRPPLRT